MKTSHYPRPSISTTTKNILLASAIAALAAGCGGTGQDEGFISQNREQLSGRVIDGYIARATVFIDANNNGTRDAWELFAFTDNDGYYSYNPITATDYCAEDANAQQQQYCLSTPTRHTDAVIRVDGGYDVLTGEAFLGQLSRRITSDDDKTDSVISPLTSIMTSARSEQQKQALLSALNLSEEHLNTDYLDTDGNGNIDAELLNKALTIHKAVVVLADRLTDTYTEIGDNYGTPNDASSSVYPALAEAIQSNGFNNAMTERSLHQVLDSAETQLREIYETREFQLPADMGDATRPGAFTRVAEIVSDISPVVDALINSEQGGPTSADVAGKARALESLVIKAVNENSFTDSSIQNAVDFFTDNTNEPLIGALVDSLSDTTADLDLLSKNDFSGSDFDSASEITESSSVPASAQPFNDIGGTTLRISDMDLGTAPNALDDSEIEFYFDGSAGDTEGSFSACIKVITDAKSDGTLGDNNSRGEVASGYWSMFGGTDAGSYRVIMTIDFLGATYQSIIRAAGQQIIDGVSYQAIGFDNDGTPETWHTLNGFTAGSVAASSNFECEARLPSRIGI